MKKLMEVADFRSLFAGMCLYRDLLPAVVGMIMTRTLTSYSSTMKALLYMDGKFSFRIIDLPRAPILNKRLLLAENLTLYHNIIMLADIRHPPDDTTPRLRARDSLSLSTITDLRSPSVKRPKPFVATIEGWLTQTHPNIVQVSPTDTIETLLIPQRISKVLRAANIHTIEQLTVLTPEALRKIDGLGEWSVRKIVERLPRYGLRLGMNIVTLTPIHTPH